MTDIVDQLDHMAETEGREVAAKAAKEIRRLRTERERLSDDLESWKSEAVGLRRRVAANYFGDPVISNG